MPATALDIARRTFLAALAAPLLAGSPQEVLNLFTDLASALSEGNGLAFLDRVDHSMPDYEKLQRDILALVAQNELVAAIDVLEDEGDDHTRAVQLDWILQIRSREETGALVRRRETVKCRLDRVKKKWKVASLDPISLFAPPT
jgi:hypothetical protein